MLSLDRYTGKSKKGMNDFDRWLSRSTVTADNLATGIIEKIQSENK